MADLKTKRATSKSQFTRADKRLNDVLSQSSTIPILTVERRYNELSEKWNCVQEAHDAHLAVLSSSDDGDASDRESWIDEIKERFDAIEIKVDQILEELQLEATFFAKSVQ